MSSPGFNYNACHSTSLLSQHRIRVNTELRTLASLRAFLSEVNMGNFIMVTVPDLRAYLNPSAYIDTEVFTNNLGMQFERLIYMLELFKLRLNKITRNLFRRSKRCLLLLQLRRTKHHASSPPLNAPFHSFGLPKFNVNYELLFNKLFPFGRESQKKGKTKHQLGSS